MHNLIFLHVAYLDQRIYIFFYNLHLTDLFGSFDIEPKEIKEKKARQTRKSNAIDESLATQTAKAPKNTETGASLTEMLVNSTLKQLENAYELNDRNPISYFNFVLDPQSFTKSSENMFHFSFLVKEGSITIDNSYFKLNFCV